MGIGEYRIDRAIGDGRFDAHHAVLGRRVTIKVAVDAAPLLREARALERLRHPRVPRVYECEPARSRRLHDPGDDAASLHERIKAVERRLYPDTIARVARGELP